MLKIRRPLGRLIFNMGIAIPGKTVFLIETAPCFRFYLDLDRLNYFLQGYSGELGKRYNFKRQLRVSFFIIPSVYSDRRSWWAGQSSLISSNCSDCFGSPRSSVLTVSNFVRVRNSNMQTCPYRDTQVGRLIPRTGKRLKRCVYILELM